MAVEIESRGQLLDFLEVLRRRSWQVILPAALVITLGAAFAVFVPKKYLVTTQIELRPVGISVSSKEGGNAPFQLRAKERVKKVVEKLGNTDYLALAPEERGAFLNDILNNLKVKTDRGDSQGSVFVTVTYSDVQPQWAVDFLRELRSDWIYDVLERDRNKVEDERANILAERKKLEDRVKAEEDALTTLRRENDLSATQQSEAGPRNEDPVFARLQESTKSIKSLDIQLQTQVVRIAALEEQYQRMPENLTRENVVPGVGNEEALKQVDLEILEQQEILQGLGQAHSKYKLARKRLAELSEKREQLNRLVTKSQSETVSAPNQERMRLLLDIDGAKAAFKQMEKERELLAAQAERDQKEFRRLQDVYREDRALAALVARLRVTLEDTDRKYQEKVLQVAQLHSPLANPFEITEDVAAPNKPTEPNPWLIVAFSIAAGFGMGIALAVGLEYTKSSFRSPHDLSRVMVVPVLGTINAIVTRREKRLRGVRRAAVGLSSAAFILSVVFVTWAWKEHPTLLSPALRDTIEDLRSKFR
ncbi:MAG: GumC family protein [Planctomycetota bacterium]